MHWKNMSSRLTWLTRNPNSCARVSRTSSLGSAGPAAPPPTTAGCSGGRTRTRGHACVSAASGEADLEQFEPVKSVKH
jgi:hypothetical protein